MQYLVWDHKTVAGVLISQMELSFSSPRHAAASWLAKPRPLGSLDFVSPEAMVAGTLVLANPAQIFEGAKELARLSNSNAFATVPQAEQALKLSLKDDLLSLLGGEIAVELDTETSPQPVWKAILAVNDANHLQQTLDALVVQVHFEASQVDDGGVTGHTLRIPSDKGTTELAYAFSDGYMVVGSSRDAVAEAVQLHRSGGSLAKSTKFMASLPPGRQMEASALLYEDPLAMVQLSLQSLKPVLPEYLTQHGGEVTPTVIRVYGEEAAIREESTNSTFDATGLLIGAAIAIPNLLRSRIAANEASAVGSLRTMTTAQLTYEAMYPTRGYATLSRAARARSKQSRHCLAGARRSYRRVLGQRELYD